MTHSLRAKLSGLHYKGILEDKDYKRLCHALDLEKAEQEQKSGQWIEMDGYDGDVYYDCSECGESWTTIEGTPWDNGMKYCPNCGAKMESEVNNG